MEAHERPWRSVLYIPGSKERALEKARSLPVDAIIFDLEDAVAPDEKAQAREVLAAALAEGGYGARVRIVRINGLETEWGADDAAAVARMGCDAVLMPKVGSPEDVERLAQLIPDLPIWAMMETPGGCLNAAAIAAHPRLQGFVMGTNDLAKDLGARFRPDRLSMMTALQMCLMAARASGVICVDGVYNAFKDADGLRRECEQGRDIGMDGKTLIHPAQIEIANQIFGPSAEDLDLAKRQIAAFGEAVAKGEGVAVVDGQIVENLHVATARAMLAKARIIAQLEGK
jgi:(3S)-malyl-CoA thioesterase